MSLLAWQVPHTASVAAIFYMISDVYRAQQIEVAEILRSAEDSMQHAVFHDHNAPIDTQRE